MQPVRQTKEEHTSPVYERICSSTPKLPKRQVLDISFTCSSVRDEDIEDRKLGTGNRNLVAANFGKSVETVGRSGELGVENGGRGIENGGRGVENGGRGVQKKLLKRLSHGLDHSNSHPDISA